MTTFKANRKFPNPVTVTDDPKSHTLALQQIIEALNVGQRRTKEVMSSYVRVHELVDAGLIEVVGNQLKLTNAGAAVVSASGVQSIVAGTNISVDDTDPANPIVSAAAVGGGAFQPSDLYDASLSDLSDCSVYMPRHGDVLTYDATTGMWYPEDPRPVSIDTRPVSPSAYDDEFDGTSLDPKWSWFNQSSASISLANGSALMTTPAASGDNSRGIVQSETGASWTYRARIATGSLTNSGANYFGGGVVIRNSSGPKNVMFLKLYANGWKLGAQTRTDTTYVGSIAEVTLADYGHRPEMFDYWEMSLASGTITLKYSPNGVSWRTIGSTTVAAYLGSITHVGLCVFVNNASYGAFTACDWFRRVA